jgi:hypothetical protein
LLAIYQLGETLFLRVIYIPSMYNTVYKLHLKYNFPRLRGEVCFLGYFISNFIYQFCIIEYTNHIHFKYNFPRFCSCWSVHVCVLLKKNARSISGQKDLAGQIIILMPNLIAF